MIRIVCRSRIYNVPSISQDAEYKINPPIKIRKHLEVEIMQDFADILVRGYKILRRKSVPEKIDITAVKYDLLEKEEQHDRAVQKQYLRETRKYWEARYDFDELIWMLDFQDYIAEIGGNVSTNWYIMYSAIRGDLPCDIPPSICFSIMIDNIFNWKVEKYINRTVKAFFEQNPKAMDVIIKGQIPEGIELKSEIGLIMEEYVAYAKEHAKCVQ